MKIAIHRSRAGGFSVSPAKRKLSRVFVSLLLAFSVVMGLVLVATSATAEPAWIGDLSIGADYQFNTSLDDANAEFDFWHTNVRARAERRLGHSSKWGLSLGAEHRAFGFRFDGLTGGADPWDTIHVVRLAPRLSYQINQTWGLFGGPMGEFSGEAGSDFSDAIRGGAIFGAMWRPNDKLMIGIGVLGMNAIEDDFLLQPVLLFDWKITDSLRLTTQSWTSRGGRLELIYGVGDGWDVAFSGGRERERFRLDTNKAANISRGVGEENSIPLSLRVSKTLRSGMKISAFGGVAVRGELRVETADGNNVAVSDYDRAAFAGLSVSLPF